MGNERINQMQSVMARPLGSTPSTANAPRAAAYSILIKPLLFFAIADEIAGFTLDLLTAKYNICGAVTLTKLLQLRRFRPAKVIGEGNYCPTAILILET